MLRDGQYTSLHPTEILAGDIVKLEQGSIIPADGLLITSQRLQVNESSLTGENDNVDKESHKECLRRLQKHLKHKERSQGDHAKREILSAVVISGTSIVEGTGEMVTIAVGKNSKEGRIVELAQQEDDQTPLEKKLDALADKIANYGLISGVTIVVVLFIRFFIELGAGVRGWDTGQSINDMISFLIIGISILAVAIPEGLPLAVAISLAYSVNKMQKDNNLVKRLHACETMGGADTICSDKTGTLTKNQMEVQRFSVNGVFIDQDQFANFFEKNPEYSAFLEDAVFLTSVARIEDNKEIGSKTELALLKLLGKGGRKDYTEARQNAKENILVTNPFSSSRKRQSIILDYDSEIRRVYVIGASEYLVESCTHSLSTNTEVSKVGKNELIGYMKDIDSMAAQGLRTIGVAFKDIDKEVDIHAVDKKGFPIIEQSDLTLIGIFGIYDPPRDEVEKALKECKEAHIKVRMVTGDNPITALAIAKNIGIADDNSVAMIGEDFRKEVGGVVCQKCKTALCECSRNPKDPNCRNDVVGNLDAFKKVVEHLDILARSQPEDKYTLVTGLKQLGHVVAVTGDGTNDAPALKKANVGFAMGIAGTELAREAADIILLDDNFNSIVKAVMWGRSIYDNVQKFIQFQITVNVVAVITSIVASITIQMTPLTAVQLLWVNLVMDTFASLALATEKPSEDLLKRPPHRMDEFIISGLMFKHILGQAVLQCAILFTMIYAGELFLREFGDTSDQSVMVNPENEDYVRSGRLYHLDGTEDYKPYFDDPDIGPSRHFTYIFNTFVLMQLFNEINSRKVHDEIWVFSNLSRIFVLIWIFTFGVQILMVTFGSYALSVHIQGLTIEQWFICLAFGVTPLIWRFFILLLPFKKEIHAKPEPEVSHRTSSIHRGSQSLKRKITNHYNPS